MMKKIVLLVMSLIMASVAYAQVTFFATSPSGHQLLYEVTGSDEVMLIGVGPESIPISGNLVIPSTVSLTPLESYTVTSIEDYLFAQSSGLTGVSIPSTITSIGASQFSECGALTSITVDASNPVYDSRNNCNAIIHTATNTLLTGCRTTTIPSTVTAIGEEAFYGMLTGGISDTIVIPASVSSIFIGAFGFCESLDCITVDAGNPYFDSRDNCNAIINTATNTLIVGCRTTTIPSSVTAIGEGAFSGMIAGGTSDTIAIPASVSSISEGVFSYCESLDCITVDASNPYYDSRNNCNAIIHTATNTLVAGCRATTIPSDVTTIGKYSFGGIFFTNADSITIPASVTLIDTFAFAMCDALTGITSLATVAPTLGRNAFYSVDWNIPVRIPAGSLASYQSGWRCFTNFIELAPDTIYYMITATSADDTMGIVSGSGSYAEGENAILTATANAGFHFLHWQDGNSDNPRTISVTSDSTFVAYFEADEPQGINEVSEGTIQVYPNPTTDLLYINGTFGCAELYNLSGQRLLSTLEPVISLEGVPSGQYLLVINGTTTIKILKTK